MTELYLARLPQEARPKRMVYVQYTNPAGYPPLEHSSQILAGAGWKVLFLGTGAAGGADGLRFSAHPSSAGFRAWAVEHHLTAPRG